MPAEFIAIRTEVAAPLACVANVKSQPKPTPFKILKLSLVILKIPETISEKETLIKTIESTKQYKKRINPKNESQFLPSFSMHLFRIRYIKTYLNVKKLTNSCKKK